METLDPLEGRVTGRMAGRLARHVQAASPPAAAQVVSWMDLVDVCRELDEMLSASEAPSHVALDLHQAVTYLAIGCGSWLIHQIQTNGVDISASGQTLETLSESLELLRILYRTRHPDFPSDEIAAVRQRIFKAAA